MKNVKRANCLFTRKPWPINFFTLRCVSCPIFAKKKSSMNRQLSCNYFVPVIRSFILIAIWSYW